jgi:hypothetical protein
MSPVRQTSPAESYRIAVTAQLSRGEMRHRPQGRRPIQPIRPRGFPSHAASYRPKPDVALVAAAWNPGSARTRQVKDGSGRSVPCRRDTSAIVAPPHQSQGAQHDQRSVVNYLFDNRRSAAPAQRLIRALAPRAAAYRRFRPARSSRRSARYPRSQLHDR